MSRVAPDGLAWSLRHRRRVMEQPTRFVGMDVHKDAIVVAVTTTGEIGNATPYGTVPNTAAANATSACRQRQARDAAWSCGNQPAYHSMINRRSVPALHRACLHQTKSNREEKNRVEFCAQTP